MQLVGGGLIVVDDTAVEIGFENHIGQKIDQVMEAPLTLLKIPGPFENLLLEKFPVDEQVDDEDAGEQD